MKMTATHSPDGRRIWVRFPYDPALVERAKRLTGASFVPREKGGPAWSYPLDLKMAKSLRECFGYGLKFSPELVEWGKQMKREEKRLRNLSRASDAKLKLIPKINPALADFLAGRPYQRADVSLMAAHSCINANDMGLGKSTEVIAATLEANLGPGRHLVVAPVTSLYSVWADEISRWYPEEWILTGETPRERKLAIEAARRRAERGHPFWLILNPDTIRFQKDKDGGKPTPIHPDLFNIVLDTATIDEFHKMGLGNPKSLGSIGASALQAHRKWALSGTPLGGRPINLWGPLNWVAPDRFPSRWHWAKEWLVVKSNGFGHDYGKIKPGREDEFYAYHAPLLIRRTKREVMPDLPPKMYYSVRCRMTKKQAEQYNTFAADAEIRIDDERLTGISVLAEYTYLKQFAAARCTVERDDDGVKVWPTVESGKLAPLVERLERHAVGQKGGEAALVFTQSARFAQVVNEFLRGKGYRTGLIAGSVEQAERRVLLKKFTTGKLDIMVIVTQAGGTSLNLQRADSVHLLDENWNPDDDDQAIDRADRGSRTKPLVVYRYRSLNTIEEQVENVSSVKRITSKNILDVRRRGWK